MVPSVRALSTAARRADRRSARRSAGRQTRVFSSTVRRFSSRTISPFGPIEPSSSRRCCATAASRRARGTSSPTSSFRAAKRSFAICSLGAECSVDSARPRRPCCIVRTRSDIRPRCRRSPRLRTSADDSVARLRRTALAGGRHRAMAGAERRVDDAVSPAARRIRVRIAPARRARGCRRALGANARRARASFDDRRPARSERRRSSRAPAAISTRFSTRSNRVGANDGVHRSSLRAFADAARRASERAATARGPRRAARFVRLHVDAARHVRDARAREAH